MYVSTLPSRRILLISPEKAVWEITQICLETIPNCEVFTADSDSQGIATAETQKINAILLDLDEKANDSEWLPIVQRLQKNPVTQDIPVILLTTATHSQDLLQLHQKGVKAAIAKSFDLLALATQVATALEWNE